MVNFLTYSERYINIYIYIYMDIIQRTRKPWRLKDERNHTREVHMKKQGMARLFVYSEYVFSSLPHSLVAVSQSRSLAAGRVNV